MSSDTANWIPVSILILFLFYTIFKFNIPLAIKIFVLSSDKKKMLNNFFSKHFYYFNQLSAKEKDVFIKRSYKLINSVKIIGRQGFELTSNMKFFVIAAYVQITFGFKYYNMPKFRTIIVYPNEYQNKITGNMHYGEVNPKGLIVLSWKRLLKGYEIKDDAINLGLHEMAHALMHTIMNSNDHESGLDNYLKEIVKLSYVEIKKIRNNENSYFRSYAGTNIYEFFAIAVESFFETPDELKSNLPKLYFYLVKLVKQDPSLNIYRIPNTFI